MTFGEKLKELRKKRKMTQEQLAELLGSHESHVGRYEKNQSYPTAPAIRRIAEVFNVSTDYLLLDRQNPQGNQHPFKDEELYELVHKIDELDEEQRQFVKKFLQLVINDSSIRKMLS